MQNMHLDLPMEEKLHVLDEFYVKLRKSGHEHAKIRDIFIEGLIKFGHMVAKSRLDKNDENYVPLYLANDYDKTNRGIIKFLRKYDWYVPGSDQKDGS